MTEKNDQNLMWFNQIHQTPKFVYSFVLLVGLNHITRVLATFSIIQVHFIYLFDFT